MKPCIPIFCLFLLFSTNGKSQVTCDPVFPNIDDNVTITFDATQGNGALAGVSPVYAHMGVITSASSSPSDWKYVKTTWGVADPVGVMTPAGANKWQKTFNIRSFFGVPQGEEVLSLAFVFRNATGSIVGRATDGSDIFYPVYPANAGLLTSIQQPANDFLVLNQGANIAVSAAASQDAQLRLLDNGALIASGNGKSLQTTLTAGAVGLHNVLFIADTPTESDTSMFSYVVPSPIIVQDPPPGTLQGIQYLDTTDSAVRLSLYAPNKQVIYVIGDFNDWTAGPDYQLRRSQDGNTWWIEIDNLTPGQPYRFQYLVDGSLRIADPLSTLVLDPWNDPFIPPFTFPNLPAYPTGKTNGIVSLIQTAQPAYNWIATDYTPPKNEELIVYEVLLRDFIARQNFQTLIDTLDYLERLGITAIELMPVNEFDGNLSWGYNPAFHKALDKFYGSPEAFKQLVDECHLRGIAVIIDVVFNHATGASPLAQLYWDGANNRPAPDNPWLNPEPKHDFNVFYDFNHESQATKDYVKNCLEYWLEEYRVDGFRFDLSKGFTQKNTLGSVSAWGVYDPSRIAIWKDYADFMWSINPDTYVILEHFAENNEEKELADYGMMLWGNMHFSYREVAKGTASGIVTSLSGVSHKQRGWNKPHLIGYMESHDEERIVYECLQGGNSANASHNVKTLPIALKRVALLQNLLLTVPGPKMFWQFGELGYDYSINYCPGNGTVNQSCRLEPKPIRWDYLLEPDRLELYNVTSALLQLRKQYDVFETADFTTQLQGGNIRSLYLIDPELRVYVIGNVATTFSSANILLNTNSGWWYEYYTGDSIFWSGSPINILMDPGEYRLYTNKYIPRPPDFSVSTQTAYGPLQDIAVFPNPFDDRFALSFELAENTVLDISLCDVAGAVVHRQTTTALPAGPQQLEVMAPPLHPGIYFLVIRDETGRLLSKKLVKM